MEGEAWSHRYNKRSYLVSSSHSWPAQSQHEIEKEAAGGLGPTRRAILVPVGTEVLVLFLLRPSNFLSLAYNKALVLHKPAQGPFCFITKKLCLRQATWLYVPQNQHFTVLFLTVSFHSALCSEDIDSTECIAAFCNWIHLLFVSFLLVTDYRLSNYFKEQKGWACNRIRERFNLKLEVENTNSFGAGPSLESVITIFATVMQTRRTRRVWSLSVNGQRLVAVWVKYQHI